MVTIELPHKFTPRHYQKAVLRAITKEGRKRAVCVWHRRAGKDKTFLNILVIMAIKKMGNYAYYFPTATLGRKALWDNIDANSGMRVIDHLPKELVAKMNEQQMKITLVNGSTIQILGTETLDVVGGNYIGVIFSESAQHNPLAWDYIRPILAENGGWAIFNGTPRGKNWFYELKETARKNPEEWFCQVLSVEDTGALAQSEIDAERRSGMKEQMIRQEYYCDFTVGAPGAIYAQWVEQARVSGRIAPMPIDGTSPVNTAWDLGSPMNTVVWYFQTVGRMIRVLGCDVDRDETAVERVARMRSLGLNYGHHFLPHDGNQTDRTGRTMSGELAAAGLQNIIVVPRATNIWLGIDHARQMFASLEFREPETEKGLLALERYHTKEVMEGMLSRNEPVHDQDSHAADAFRTMAEAHYHGLFRFTHVDTPRTQQRPQAIMGSRRW